MVIMIVVTIFSFIRTGLVNAICAIVIFNFASFLLFWFLISNPVYHAVWEMIRAASISLLCLHFSFRSKDPKPYTYLAILTLSFIILYGVHFFELFIINKGAYIALTIVEMIIFANGIFAIHKAKTKNDSILNSTDDIHDRVRRVISGRSDSA